MAEVRLLLIAAILWGASVLADLPSSGDTLAQDQSAISYNVSYLNTATPDLNLRTRVSPTDLPTATHILVDLHTLYGVLQGSETAAPGSLTTLTCARALCFGDDE